MGTIRRWRAGRHDRRRRSGAEWAAFAEALEEARRDAERPAPPGVRYRARRPADGRRHDGVEQGERSRRRLPSAPSRVEARVEVGQPA